MIKLNLGSGARMLVGYVNVDTIEFKGELPDDVQYLKEDIFNLRWHYGAGTVDEVKAYHLFEHLTHQEIVDLIYHLSDLIKIGGWLDVIVPNFAAILLSEDTKNIAGNFDTLDVLHSRIFSTEAESFHKSVWSEAIGKFYLERDGFFKLDVLVVNNDEIRFNCKRI